MIFKNISDLIALVPAMLIALAFHEWAHAAMADYMGDPTPRNQGRLSINPFVHLDLLGTVLILFSGFGWAKPVQINPMNFRGNKRRADLLVSLAGISMNFIIAFLVLLLYGVVQRYGSGIESIGLLLQVLGMIVLLNVGIGVFNLLPIPPLDGFHALCDLLPSKTAAKLYSVERYGMIVLLLVFATGLGGRFLVPVQYFILDKFLLVTGLILSVFGI